jgi:hypothetical protein
MTDSKVFTFNTDSNAGAEKKSYTAKLIEKLESVGTPAATIQTIKDFAIEQYDERKKHEELTAGTVTFGKYKGKKFEDIVKLDKPYLQWMAKNRKYISASNQVILDSVLTQNP